MALNARQERFAQLVALGGLANAEAYRQAGYASNWPEVHGCRLASNGQVASRIKALQQEASQPASHRSLQSITRQELAELLAKVIRAGFGRPELAKPHEALKASELLAKLQGWNEPEQQNHQHVHVQVDAGLLEQLRNGYQELKERKASASLTSAPAEASKACLPDGPAGMPAPPEGGLASPRESVDPMPSPWGNINFTPEAH